MKKVAILLFAIIVLTALLSSCAKGKAEAPCREILDTMISSEIGMPAGKIYDGSAESGSDEYLPDSLISALLGNTGLLEVKEGWLDCAFFLSLTDSPCEFAVIYCKDSDTAFDTARLLSAHLNEVKLSKGGSQYALYTDNAHVTVVGNFALLIISSDYDAALKAAKSKM